MGLLKPIVDNLHVNYQILPNRLLYRDAERDTTYAYHAPKDPESGLVSDFTLATKLPGLNNNTIMIFSSTHDVGQISTVRAFTDLEFCNALVGDSLQSQQDALYFETVFEVQGIERTGFSPRLLHFNPLPLDFKTSLIPESTVE